MVLTIVVWPNSDSCNYNLQTYSPLEVSTGCDSFHFLLCCYALLKGCHVQPRRHLHFADERSDSLNPTYILKGVFWSLINYFVKYFEIWWWKLLLKRKINNNIVKATYFKRKTWLLCILKYNTSKHTHTLLNIKLSDTTW